MTQALEFLCNMNLKVFSFFKKGQLYFAFIYDFKPTVKKLTSKIGMLINKVHISKTSDI